MNVIAGQPNSCSGEFVLLPGGIAELPLLLSAEQVVQLEQMARRRGLTIGQMLRLAVQALLDADLGAPPRPSEPTTSPPDALGQVGESCEGMALREAQPHEWRAEQGRSGTHLPAQSSPALSARRYGHRLG